MPLSEVILVVMGLLTVAMIAAAICRNIPVPYTVFLVILGIILGSFARFYPEFEFLLEFQLTPDLVLFIFLPALIFESAINLDARLLMKDIIPVLVLAVPAMLISAGLIGLGLWAIQDFNIFHALLFGALISATDPVAVIALFKELGAPQRLTILVEGESLLNDATAIVFFNIILGLSITGQFAVSDVGAAILEFLKVFFGGLIVGAIIGIVLSELLYRIRAGMSSYLIMSIVLAYSSFAIAEHVLHVSGVMAVVSAAIALGILGVSRIPQNERETVDETWDVIALICNSLLFLLVGLSVDISQLYSHIDSILIAIVLVLGARAAGVYSMVPATIKMFKLPNVSMGERHIMWWGGLKGGLAIAIVLSIPIDMPGRDTILYITLGVVLFSLLINAPTIRPLMKKLGFDQFTGEEVAELRHGLLQSQQHAEDVLESFHKAKLISRSTQQLIQKKTQKIFSCDYDDADSFMEERHAYMTALRIEMQELKYLYDIGFLQYYTYMNIKNTLQRDRETWSSNSSSNVTVEQTKKINPFVRLENALIKQLREVDFASGMLARYQYLRFSQSLQRDIAGILISEKVIEHIQNEEDLNENYKIEIINSYKQRSNRRKNRLEKIAEDFPDFYLRFETRLFAKVALVTAGFYAEEAEHHGEIGSKVFTNIERRINEAINALQPISDPAPKLKPHDLIGTIPLLNGLPNDLLERLSKHARAMTFLSGDLVIGEGEKGDSLYIITHGLVLVYKNGHEDEPIANFRDGEFFGEMALLESQVRTANVKALKPTTLLRLRRKDVLSMAENEPELKARLEQISSARRSTET
ncbi:MAG: cation:proton antiporter [Gammaproteobacteria bacterium]|jgi:CPA1 family monovalent cation:H+ antiporter